MAFIDAQGEPDQGSWLTLSEAAARSGLHREALRARAKSGQLQHRRSNRGEMLVLLPPELLTLAQSPAQGLAHHAQASAQPDTQVAHGTAQELAQAQVEQLVELLRDVEGELSEAKATIAALAEQVKAAQAVAVADVATARAEVAAKEQVLAELRQTIEHERARADRLDELVRRPWWRRLIGS